MKQVDHGADVEKVKRAYGINEVLDYSSNVNIFSPGCIDDILGTVSSKDLNYYLDPNYISLREKIANHHSLNKENIITGNGSTEIMFLIMRMKRIKKVGILQPTFGEYERAALIEEKEITDFYYDENFNIDIDSISKKIRKIDLLIICNPNNPSGNVNHISHILDFCRDNNIILMIDETFMDFVSESEDYSLISKIRYYDNLIIIRALTKFHALTNVRLGYAAGSPELIDELWKYKEPWSVNFFAQKLIDVIDDTQFYAKSKSFYSIETSRFVQKLSQLDKVKAFPSNANFILLRIDNGKKACEIKDEMIKKYGILIRDCSNFKGLDDRYIRINVKEKEKNDFFFECFKKIIQ